MPLLRHALLALALSLTLSTTFYLAFGVFVMPGFVVMSLAAAAGGTLIGWLAARRLWLTAIATILIRLAIFLVATRSSEPIPCA